MLKVNIKYCGNIYYVVKYRKQIAKESEIMKVINGSIIAPRGFKAYGLRAGIKPGKTNKDMAVILSDKDAVCAGAYTRNRVKAAPVIWDKKVTDRGTARAVIINSGIANACTGERGYDDTSKTAQILAGLIDSEKEKIRVASTGIIGANLPMEVIEKGANMLVPLADNTEEAADLAAEAIMTTDTHSKKIAVEFELVGKTVRMGGMCKGSGMIHPNMGTMLSFITTDAVISHEMLDKALKEDVENTYNMVSVDGDTSTNDTVVVIANGMAENAKITSENQDYEVFCAALNFVNEYLAKQIAADGEGATKLLEVKVQNAVSPEDAKILAKSVITSNLTKAAVFGRDANWGRILCALGYSGGEFEPDKTEIALKSSNGELVIVKNGVGTGYSEDLATQILSADEVTVSVDLHGGAFSATAWGCDLTYDYVKINADYRS